MFADLLLALDNVLTPAKFFILTQRDFSFLAIIMDSLSEYKQTCNMYII